MCGMNGHSEESGLLGEIFTGFQKKKTQKLDNQTALVKGMMEVQAEKRRLATEKEVNRIKTVKYVVIGFSALIIVVAIIVAVVKLKQNKTN